MTIPQVQYCDAVPLGVASLLAFVASLFVVCFVMAPKIRRVQNHRKALCLRTSSLLEQLGASNDKLECELQKWQSKSQYGPLHHKWEVYYRRAIELYISRYKSIKSQRELEAEEVARDPKLHVIANRALSKMIGADRGRL